MMGLAVKLRIITAVLLYFTAVAAQNLTTYSATYNGFYPDYQDLFQLQNSAAFSDGLVQLTMFSGDQFNTMNLSGRVMLKQRFKLWEQGYNKTSDRVASFNCSFLFYLGPTDGSGEGLAFVLAPDTDIPSNSFGQYLGLTNFSTNGSPENHLLAIEFDNFKEYFDPDANHVGLNINSIISHTNVSLNPLGIELANLSVFYNAWVEYDGVNKVIEVYMAPQAESDGETPSKPDAPVLKSNLDLSEVLHQHSYFGFSASTGESLQDNTVFAWNLTVDSYLDDAPAPKDKHRSWEKTLLVVGVGVGFPLLMMGAAVTGYYYLFKKRSMAQCNSNGLLGTLKRLPGTPREFQFKDLKKATNNFDEKKKLGQGGFGVVYRGYLQNENMEVAVKWFSRKTIKGQDDFLTELTIINRLRHKHLVRLLGKCFCKFRGFSSSICFQSSLYKVGMVYGIESNGSLMFHFIKILI